MANATIPISDGAGNVIVPPMDADEFSRRANQISAEAALTQRVVKKKLAGKGEAPMAERGNTEMFSREETGEATSMTVAAGQLRAFIERVERLEEEKATIAEDIRQIYAEAKGTGFDTKAIRTIVRLRKKDQAERQEEETILDLYKAALGME